MMLYYHEPKTGEYLSVDHSTRDYYRRIGQPRSREARACALQGQPLSICTTSIDVNWLRRNCRRVKRADVPRNYLSRL